MYITEISLKDYRKLGKKGYRAQRVECGAGIHRIEPVDIGDPITDGDVEYARSFGHKAIALFINEADECESVEDSMVLDKYCANPSANHCVWAGVEHIYSEKGRWFVKADSECGYVSKRLFGKVYLIHAED